MFNTTAIFEEYGGNGNQMMIVVGMLMTSVMTSMSGFGRSLLDNLYRVCFFHLHMDESREDSPQFTVSEGLYKKILQNRSCLLQGWKARLIKSDFESSGTSGTSISGHQFSITPGGVFFWIGWQLYYAEYNMSGNNWWPQNKMDIYGFRWSSWNLVRFMKNLSDEKEKRVKWNWRYGRDDDAKWNPGVGRDRYFTKPYYMVTSDSQRVIDEVDRYTHARKSMDDHLLIKQANIGRFLLYGPPGTGKTTLVKKIAYEKGYDLYVATQDELNDRSFKKMIETLPPNSILLLDDIDLDILKKEEVVPENGRRRGSNLKAVMKSVMEGTTTLPDDCLYFISCNNTVLDPEITSRFSPFPLGFSGNEWRKKVFSDLFEGGTQRSLNLIETHLRLHEISQREFSRVLARSYEKNNPFRTANNILKEFVIGWKGTSTCEVV